MLGKQRVDKAKNEYVARKGKELVPELSAFRQPYPVGFWAALIVHQEKEELERMQEDVKAVGDGGGVDSVAEIAGTVEIDGVLVNCS